MKDCTVRLMKFEKEKCLANFRKPLYKFRVKLRLNKDKEKGF